MRAYASWKGGYESALEDGRGHSVTVDLPTDEEGQNRGPSALELAVLSLAGCVSTIFALVARRRRLRFEEMRVELEAVRPRGAQTITSVEGIFHIATSVPEEEVVTALNLTLRTCPVGVLFERAGIPVRVRPIVERRREAAAVGPPTLLARA